MKYIVTTRHTDLRIREGPGTGYRIIGGLPQGRPVEVLDNQPVEPRSRAPGWKKLANRSGWVYAGDHGEFLTLPPTGAGVAANAPPSPEQHTLLFFGGACPTCPPGADMTPTDTFGPRTSQTAYEYFIRSGRFAAAPKWNSSVSSSARNPAVDAGFRFLQRPSLPGKLVIYGFSAGGFNAVQLCELIAAPSSGMSGRRVDLLLTVDPCIQDIELNGPFPIQTPRPPVVAHFNWYQLSGPDHYSGRPIPGAVNAPPQTPPPGPRSAHDQMPTHTKDFVETLIAKLLQSPARALRGPP